MPCFPGITSALGCVIADVRHDTVLTVNLMLAGLDPDALDRRMIEAAAEVRAVVDASGVPLVSTDIAFEFDMHYLGQTHAIGVSLPLAIATTKISEETIRSAFETAYRAKYSRLLPGIPVKIVSLRTTAIGRRPKFDLTVLAPETGLSMDGASRGTRPVWFHGAWCEASVWSRRDLPVGSVVAGPAVLEQPDATTIVDPGLEATVDALGNVLLQRCRT